MKRQQERTAFCTSVPFIPHVSQRSQCSGRVIPTNAAHPPRRISSVTKDLQQALQTSLQARTSRIDVTLPQGSKLGTEKREGDEDAFARRLAGDRELARIIAGMFERTGLAVRVVFATERERSTAARMWGPLVECEIITWDTKSSSSRKASSSKSGGGGGIGKAKKSAKSGFGKEEVADPDVYIVVGGGASFMTRVRSLAGAVGMDKLIITANGNGTGEQVPIDLKRYMDEEFESVYYYKPNPHPKWSGGVLFRKFPDGMLPRITLHIHIYVRSLLSFFAVTDSLTFLYTISFLPSFCIYLF